VPAVARWVKVCQLCWERLRPDQYFPDRMDFDTCGICGDEALVVNVHPSEVSE
jgi:rRNA maturation endonuclease Nob1